jgi:uncharacterized membrane protein YgcG
MEKCKNCNKWLGYGETCNCNNNSIIDTVIDIGTTVAINSLFDDNASSSSSSNDNSSFDSFGGGDFGGGGSSGDF